MWCINQADYLELHKENSGLKTRLRGVGGGASPSNTVTGAHHHHNHLHQLNQSDFDLLHQVLGTANFQEGQSCYKEHLETSEN